MGEISLEGIEIFAYHGLYDEERQKGSKFLIDIKIETNFDHAAIDDDISGTVNYEKLYYIISREMAIPSKLLENVTKRIVDKTLAEFPQILSISVAVSKLNPSIKGLCEKAKIHIFQKSAN